MQKNKQSPLINEATGKDVVQLFRRLYAKMGTAVYPDEDVVQILISSTQNILGHWRISQVEHAFDLGLMGILELDMNLYNKPLNMVFLSSLMNAYKKYITPMMQAQIQEQMNHEEKLTDQEKKITELKAIRENFNYYKRTGRIINAGNIIYECLQDKIKITNDQVRQAAENVHKVRLSQKIERAGRGSLRNMIKKSIERVKTGDYNQGDETEIARIMCDLKLKLFFDDCIEIGVDPIELEVT